MTIDIKGKSLERLVNHCYVFFRKNHDWHSDTVVVLAKRGNRFTVARACDVCERLLAKDKLKGKLKKWTCTSEELW